MNGNVMTQINPTLLAVHIAERIEALKDLVKSLPDSGEHKLLQSMLDGLAQEHQALVATVNQGMTMLHEVNSGLSAAVKLLAYCEEQKLSGHDLASLIAPQQRNLLRGIEHASKIL